MLVVTEMAAASYIQQKEGEEGWFSHVQEKLEGAEEGGGVLGPDYDTYFSLKKRTEMAAASDVQLPEGEEG